tara:strand:+ start:1010 stop:1348 length:339 start_codon:yes stop_codon:yes gene_type:complete
MDDRIVRFKDEVASFKHDNYWHTVVATILEAPAEYPHEQTCGDCGEALVTDQKAEVLIIEATPVEVQMTLRCKNGGCGQAGDGVRYYQCLIAEPEIERMFPGLTGDPLAPVH